MELQQLALREARYIARRRVDGGGGGGHGAARAVRRVLRIHLEEEEVC